MFSLLAQTPCSSVTDDGVCIIKENNQVVDRVVTLKWFDTLFGNVVSIILALGGVILFIMLIKGGFSYITSGGEAKAAESARKTITSALFGIVLLALAYLFLVFIKQFTGVDVTKFSVFRNSTP